MKNTSGWCIHTSAFSPSPLERPVLFTSRAWWARAWAAAPPRAPAARRARRAPGAPGRGRWGHLRALLPPMLALYGESHMNDQGRVKMASQPEARRASSPSDSACCCCCCCSSSSSAPDAVRFRSWGLELKLDLDIAPRRGVRAVILPRPARVHAATPCRGGATADCRSCRC
jgi:hypothetical protein